MVDLGAQRQSAIARDSNRLQYIVTEILSSMSQVYLNDERSESGLRITSY